MKTIEEIKQCMELFPYFTTSKSGDYNYVKRQYDEGLKLNKPFVVFYSYQHPPIKPDTINLGFTIERSKFNADGTPEMEATVTTKTSVEYSE